MLRLGERLELGRLSWPRSPLRSWSLLPSSINGLVLVPIDLETPDPGFVGELASGHLGLGGTVVEFGRGSPFVIADAPHRWQLELQRFGWLRHLRASTEPKAPALARRLIADWIRRHRRPSGMAWRTDVLAGRVLAWLCNAGLLLDEADPAFYREVLASLGSQIRRLDRNRHRLPPGPALVEARITLLIAALATDPAERHVDRLEAELVRELSQQILADGCHVGRNPAVALRLLLALLPLRQCVLSRGRDLDPGLKEPIERMLAFLHHVRLGDGSITRANGMGLLRSDRIGMVLSYAPASVAPSGSVPPGGYVRLAAGGTVIVADVGAPPPLVHATAAHAGSLAFEMSVGDRMLLRNCGTPEHGALPEVASARATASHNTLTLDARSSSQLVSSPRVERRLGARPLRGPDHVAASLASTPAGETVLTADHDGYAAEHGIVHARRLALSADGTRLEGRDRLSPRSGVLRLAVDLPFAVHFHLAEGVHASLDADSGSATLKLPDGRVWRFACSGARPSIEGSIDYAHTLGPRAARQIVLRGVCPGETTIDWSLVRLPQADEAST